MTNYEMLSNRRAVVEAMGEDFVTDWYDDQVYRWNRDAFGCGSRDNSKFFNDARKMYDTWISIWSSTSHSKSDSYKHIVFDFGWWLFKQADVALFVPQGVAVSTQDGKVGIVMPQYSMSGNYAIERAWVDFASGPRDVDPKNIRKANIPQSLMEYAKAAAMRELKDKCPLAKEG